MDDQLEELRKRAEVIMAAETAQAQAPRPSVLYVPAGARLLEAAPPAESPPVAQAAVPPARPPAPSHAAAAAAPRKPNGRFVDGVSGNLKGRPKKRERSFTSVQEAEDWLNEIEEPTVMRIKGKAVTVPYHIALIKRIKHKAIEDLDVKLVDMVFDKYSKAVEFYADSVKEIIEGITYAEKRLKFEEDPEMRRILEEGLAQFRRLTRPSKI